MSPKSLMELATMACIKHIKGLESIGDFLPYEKIRYILMKVDNAHQLRQIELNSPQIQGLTGEIWLKIIEREFPLEYKANLYKPQDPKRWYKVWEKYKKEHDNALQESERKLMNAFAGLKQDKEKNTSKIVGGKQVPGALRVAIAGPKRYWGGPTREPNTSVLLFGAGSRTKTNNGASVMRKVRREVKEIATIHGSLSRPTKSTNQPIGIKKAPESMISDYKRALQPVYRPLPKEPEEPEEPSAVEEHEQRATFISDSEEEEYDDALPVTKSDAKYSQPSAQNAKSVAGTTRQPAGSSFQRKFSQAKSPAKKPNMVTSTSSSAKPSSSGVKKMPGILSNNRRPPVNRPQEKSLVPTTPQKLTSKPVVHSNFSPPLPMARTTPPAGEGPPSPESAEQLEDQLAAAEEQEQQVAKPMPRKRKAVGIFMKPKRRAM
ncbi:hypothetical protein PT974_09216 [Cladobotryum mycophilum]|uniref:Elongin-A n=1 Tax=Cladobotryum mycophilum TaxID=491253 RepID=A0ABR0SFP1_9HYPO